MENVIAEVEKFENFTTKGKEKIAEICRTAAQVFSERGYLNATLADIAHAIGTTKGGIYHYFSTKEELFFLILYRYLDTTLREMERKLKLCKSSNDKLQAFIQQHINHYQANPAESRLALHETENLPPNYREIIKEKEREYVGVLKAIVENLMKGRKKNARKVTLISYSLLGMLSWPYLWFNPKGKTTPGELSEIIYRIFTGDLNFQNTRKGE